ncbi:MAG: hypothetical protein LRY54_03760 [Alphaproteobacteria bacterium]|nr:hypothetical protein [Alphaproteobacteria bacterium]
MPPTAPPAPGGGLLKDLFSMTARQIHPFGKGRLGSNCWQQLALFVVCSGLLATTGFVPGVMETLSSLGHTMMNGASFLAGAPLPTPVPVPV